MKRSIIWVAIVVAGLAIFPLIAQTNSDVTPADQAQVCSSETAQCSSSDAAFGASDKKEGGGCEKGKKKGGGGCGGGGGGCGGGNI